MGDSISDSEMNMILMPLNKAITLDRNQFIKAKIDPNFDSIRPQVNILLEEILQQTKTNAEKEVSKIEFAIGKMKKWFDKDYASSDDIQKYKSILNKISDAKDKLKTQSYFGYDDALKIISDNKEIVSEIQTSIKQGLRNLETQFEWCNKELGEIPDKLHKIRTNKQRVVFLNLFSLIGIIITFLFFLITENEIIVEPVVNLFGGEPLGFLNVPAAIIMLLFLLLKLVVLLGGIPVAIYILFILIVNFGRLFVSDDQTKKSISKRNELNEQINMLKHQIATAKESLI